MDLCLLVLNGVLRLVSLLARLPRVLYIRLVYLKVVLVAPCRRRMSLYVCRDLCSRRRPAMRFRCRDLCVVRWLLL